MSTEKTLTLNALDTLFFRESRPFDTIGGSELVSVFPPPPRTVLGAVRTAIGDALGVDWHRFREENYTLPDGQKPRDIIGYGDDLGRLALNGIWLSLCGELLYPAPRFLLHKKDSLSNIIRLRIGPVVQSHLGMVHLPEKPDEEQGFQSYEDAWLTRSGLEKVLVGGVPDKAEIYQPEALFSNEARLGIARDNDTRTVENSLLYQTSHIRPHADLSIKAELSGLDHVKIENWIVRLGGEGRIAEISLSDPSRKPEKPKIDANDVRGLILILQTPARFENREGNWLPKDFRKKEINGVEVWQGEIKEVSLTLHAAVLGKVQREGGWDMANRKPREVQSLIPSGSSYYCTVDDGNIAKAIEALQGQYIGEDRKFGRGLIICGSWNANEFPTD